MPTTADTPAHAAIAPISEPALEPQVDVASTLESFDPQSRSSEPLHPEPIAAGSPAEPLLEPLVRPEADTDRIDAGAPLAPDADVLPASADGPEDHSAPPDASLSDLFETSEAEPEAPAFEASLQDEQPLSVREEQIWSGPEAIEPGTRWTESEQTEPVQPEQTGTSPDPAPAIHARAGLETSAVHLAPALAIDAETGQTDAAPPPPLVVPSLSATGRSVLLPAPTRAGEAIPYLRRAAVIAAGVVVTLTATVLLLVVLYRWVDPPTSTLMLGQRLTGVQIEQKWVPIERISSNLVHAVILSEDGAFCRHRGVDWSALEEALESSRGGSTITMQVVKNLFLWPQRSYIRKALEIMLAYVVEVVWPKERILEIYLNIAEWGPGVFGAEAAARHHFGKAAARLTAQEAAQLAVSLPSPIERQAGYPGWQTKRLANNLLIRMRAVRTTMRCVRVRRGGA